MNTWAVHISQVTETLRHKWHNNLFDLVSPWIYHLVWMNLIDKDAEETCLYWWYKHHCQCFLSCLSAGLIRLRSSPPPHLQGVEYILNITAVDDNASGGPQALSSTAQVIVGVDDVNNNKPVFEKVRRLKVQIIIPSSLYHVTLPHCFSPVCFLYLLVPSGEAISHF